MSASRTVRGGVIGRGVAQDQSNPPSGADGSTEYTLQPAMAERLAPLLSIGGKSGDTVVGLSAVRRTRDLAFIFAAATVGGNTWSELQQRRSRGTRVLRVDDMTVLTRGLGRTDASIIAIKTGSLAQGVAGRLAESSTSP